MTNGEEGMKPNDEAMIEAIELYSQAGGQTTEESNATAQEIWKIIVDNVFSIGTVGVSPAVMGIRIVKNTMGNIPRPPGQHAARPHRRRARTRRRSTSRA